MLGLKMGILKVGRFSETVFVEADNPVPAGIGQKTGHLITVMLCHHDNQVGGVKQFPTHRYGLTTHLITMFGSDAAHGLITIELTIGLCSTRCDLNPAGAAVSQHLSEYHLCQRRPAGIPGTNEKNLHANNWIKSSSPQYVADFHEDKSQAVLAGPTGRHRGLR